MARWTGNVRGAPCKSSALVSVRFELDQRLQQLHAAGGLWCVPARDTAHSSYTSLPCAVTVVNTLELTTRMRESAHRPALPGRAAETRTWTPPDPRQSVRGDSFPRREKPRIPAGSAYCLYLVGPNLQDTTRAAQRRGWASASPATEVSCGRRVRNRYDQLKDHNRG